MCQGWWPPEGLGWEKQGPVTSGPQGGSGEVFCPRPVPLWASGFRFPGGTIWRPEQSKDSRKISLRQGRLPGGGCTQESGILSTSPLSRALPCCPPRPDPCPGEQPQESHVMIHRPTLPSRGCRCCGNLVTCHILGPLGPLSTLRRDAGTNGPMARAPSGVLCRWITVLLEVLEGSVP